MIFVSFLGHWLKKITISLLLLWGVSVIVFKYFPVPFSAVMLEKQISAALHFNFSYVSKSHWVDTDQISPYMYLAVIAAEDQNFPNHWGFDIEAIQRAYQHNLNNKSSLHGASTLSQQTVKNLWLWNGRSWIRKGIETLMTPVMEVMWSKNRILTVYLNIAEFGEGVFGIEEAALFYFKKHENQLTMNESALLAAVLPNPIKLSAKKPSNYVLKRQSWIVHQMQLLGGKNFLKKHKIYP